ncbi:MAG TPA: sensor N-terminal transmembrane domain-containing protein, partial [Thermoanaerobaculia bacterium]
MNRRIIRFLSRISIRLMLFNLLLVFLPVAGIIYLGSYEQKLLAAQRRALDEEARLLSASLTASGNPR